MGRVREEINALFKKKEYIKTLLDYLIKDLLVISRRIKQSQNH